MRAAAATARSRRSSCRTSAVAIACSPATVAGASWSSRRAIPSPLRDTLPPMDEIGVWSVRCDGGSRGNPGPGAGAYALYDAAGREGEARGEYLGSVTNNVAEYRALIAGLRAAQRHDVPGLRVFMDSELVVKQMRG